MANENHCALCSAEQGQTEIFDEMFEVLDLCHPVWEEQPNKLIAEQTIETDYHCVLCPNIDIQTYMENCTPVSLNDILMTRLKDDVESSEID